MIEGIDVSHWQGVIDWAKAKAKGVGFAIIRAGSIDNATGVCYTDYQFENNINGAEAQGIPYSLYWFFRPNHSAVKQAEYFLALAEKANLGTMASDLWCDIEVAGQAAVVKAFCELLTKSWLDVGIYTNPNTALYLLTGDKAWMEGYDLWLADWTAPANVPAPWTEWAIWQYGVLQDGLEYGCQSKGLDHNQAQEWMIVPPVVPPEPHTHPDLEVRIEDLANDVGVLTADLRTDLSSLIIRVAQDEAFISALTARVAALEAAPAPQPTGATFRIGDSQALARTYRKKNAAGKPIFEIYPYDTAPVAQRIKWLPNTVLTVNPPAVIVGDGGLRCYRISAQDIPFDTLFVREQDGVLTQ